MREDVWLTTLGARLRWDSIVHQIFAHELLSGSLRRGTLEAMMERLPDPEVRVVAERRAAVDRVAGLAGQVAALAEQQALTTHDDEHDPEGVTIGFERAQLQGLLAGARKDLSALDRAADRIAAGSYGRCLRCGVPIPAERLDALPAAETCLACASRRR